MKRYYVYHLIDPRDGKPFYVGKGQRNRIQQHEAEARKAGANQVTSAKCNRIREIWAAGLEIKRCKVEFFADEDEAYAYELEQILALPELTNLCRTGWIGNRRIQQGEEKRRKIKFTDSLIARIAWIVATSHGLKDEFTVVHAGAGRFHAAVGEILNKFGLVQLARQTIERWIEERGREKVCGAFKEYGIEIQSTP